MLAITCDEPVTLGAAMLGAVAGGCHDDVATAMRRISAIGSRYEPAGGEIASRHQARYRAFTQLQGLARGLRQAG